MVSQNLSIFPFLYKIIFPDYVFHGFIDVMLTILLLFKHHGHLSRNDQPFPAQSWREGHGSEKEVKLLKTSITSWNHSLGEKKKFIQK